MCVAVTVLGQDCSDRRHSAAGDTPLLVYGEALRLGHKPTLLWRAFKAGRRNQGSRDKNRRSTGSLEHPGDRLAQQRLRRAPGHQGSTRKPGREIGRNLHATSLPPSAPRSHTTLWSVRLARHCHPVTGTLRFPDAQKVPNERRPRPVDSDLGQPSPNQLLEELGYPSKR
jgi:hypothetical protein